LILKQNKNADIIIINDINMNIIITTGCHNKLQQKITPYCIPEKFVVQYSMQMTK